MDQDLIKAFSNQENLYLIPPYLHKNRDTILKAWKSSDYKNHVFLFSSGTTNTSKLKSYIISKKAILENAMAVNHFLGASKEDSWLATLPPYHIGGLSIYARASLLNAKVFESPSNKWDINHVFDILSKNKISFFSVVPLQLLELINHSFLPNKSLKGIFVGGDFLSTSLANMAIENQIPIIKTFGMTELSSQIASSYYKDIKDGYLEVLPLHKIKDQMITSKSLFSALCVFDGNKHIITHNESDTFKLPDRFDLINGDIQYIKPLGRLDEMIKLKGRLVNFLELKDQMHEVFMRLQIYGRIEMVLVTNTLAGTQIDLYAENSLKLHQQTIHNSLIEELPFLENLITFRFFDELPKTSIGKIKRM